jgi:hypothetical protein
MVRHLDELHAALARKELDLAMAKGNLDLAARWRGVLTEFVHSKREFATPSGPGDTLQ